MKEKDTANLVLLAVSLISGIIAIIFAAISYSNNESMRFASVSLGIGFLSITLSTLSNIWNNKRNKIMDASISEMKSQLNRIESGMANTGIDIKKNCEYKFIEKQITEVSFFPINFSKQKNKREN